MAAVHARNRDVYELTQSIGRQIAPQEAIAGVDHLIRFVKSMPESPLIVVDALDESIEPTAVMSELLLRIIDERNASGGPICRMLVGTRDEERFSHLFGTASPHAIIDLDKTDFGRLETDISSYIQDLIREQDPHLDRAMVRAFAAATAEKVTPKERPGSGSRIEIGPFLLAQIHTFRMIDGPLLQIGDVDVAKSLGSAAPVTVEEAFLSEFEEESEPWLKPLLTAFALSFGNGMPLLHARSIAVNITAGELPWRSDRELRELAFGRARFYLRTDIDIDGSTLYGLFHQSLQEYLLRELDARTSEAYASTFAALRDDLGYGPASGPDWENRVTPYLRRYFGSYARRAGELDSVVSDIHFLIHAEHNHVMDSLRSLQTIQARRTAAAYRISHSYHRIADSDSRLFRLALDAARINEAKLLTDIRNLSATSTAILPRWSTGTIAAYVPTTDVREIDFEATVIRVTRFEGRKVCVIGCYDGEIQVRDLKSGDLLQRFYTNRWPLRDVTCAETEGDVLAISVSQGMAYVWSLTSGSLVRVIGTPADRLSVVATIRWGCRDLLVTGAVEGKLKVWDLARGSQLHTLTGKRGVSRSMACFVLNGRPVAAAATDSGRTHVWDLLTGELLRSFEVVAEYVTCIHLSGKPMLITANAAGAVRTLDLNTSHCEEQFALRRGVPIKLASSVLDGNPVLVVHGPRDSGWVGIWDLADRRFVRELRSYLTNATAVVVEEVAGRTLAVTASADRHLYWCDLSVKPSIDEVLVPMSPIKAIAVTEIGPHTVAVSGGIDGSIEVWNLSSRERTLPTINSSQGIGVTDIACVNMNGQVVAAVLLEDGSLGTLLIHPDISPITQHLPAQGQYSLDREQHLALDGASTKPSFVVARKTRLHIVNFQGDDSWVFDLAALDAPAQPRVGSIDIHEGIYRILSLDVYSTPAQSWAVVCSSSVRSSSIDWLQREVRVYDLREKLLIRKFNAPGLKRLIVADIDDTKVVAGVGDACRISVWDIATGRRLRTIGPEKEWTSITYGIIGQQHVALVGAADGELSIWDIVSGRELFTQIFPAAINRVTVAIQAVVVSFGDDLAVVDVPGLGTRA
ncbi:WD40 repeat domain-containing protein [Mycolicibacterium rufum]|uniref:WD40 repeat domain-containing protein n=1 Tax=Mycolicibacterium rufum TaxID=318424 RepID=A0A9X2YC81_9MYCO|nr:WD40 repeat domain-containing protein [Mycolicibacterium rufum]MCV7071309.1 WD40 repeat domain-containing protein [Mycolicibacterium rufum]ULP37368.1 WD40 repeat domain-containing protein [Mycolicibacterium rufum]